MATRGNVFSRMNANTKGEVKVRWWIDPKLTPSIPTRPRYAEATRMIEGTVAQYHMVETMYTGSQCTSICLEAISWWTIVAKCGDFTAVSLDHINYSGHYLHIYMRDFTAISLDHINYSGNYLHIYMRWDLNVSNESDGRVGIDDLPDKCRTEAGVFYNKRTSKEYVSMKRDGSNFLEFRSLRDYLLINATGPFAIVITIGHFSQAVFYNTRQRWLVFDSHGGLSCGDHDAEFASVWEFETVDATIAFLVNTRCRGDGYCLVTKPFILSSKAFASQKEKVNVTHRSCGGDSLANVARSPVGCPARGKIEQAPLEFDDDPYVSFMGGFGC